MKGKNVLKRVCVGLTVATAFAACFTACGEGEEEKKDVLNADARYPIVKEEYRDELVFDMMAPSYYTLDIDWKNNAFFRRMNDLTGIDFKFDKVFNTEMYAVKKSTVLSATSQMPDFFMKAMFDKTEIIRYGSQGLIIPLEGYIDGHMPNLKALMDADPYIRRAITAPDGHIYSFPSIGQKGEYDFTGLPWINAEWLDKLGLSMPETPNEFAAALRAFRDGDPNGNGKKDEVPMLLAGDFELNYLFSFFGVDEESYFQSTPDGKLEFGPETDRYKKALAWIHSLLDEGLIRADYENYTISQKWNEASAGSVNTVGFFIDYAAYAVVGYDKAGEYETLCTVKNEFTGTPLWYGSYDVTDGLFVITKKCAYPEVLCRWIDTLYDPQYAVWAEYGAEGAEWKWDDAEKTSWSFLIPAEKRAEHFGKSTVQGGGNMPFYKTSKDFLAKCSERSIADNAEQMKRVQRIGFDGFPKIYLKNNVAIRQAAVMYADISKYIETVKKNAIKSGDIVAAYKDYDSMKKQLNIDSFLGFYREGYDIFMNN